MKFLAKISKIFGCLPRAEKQDLGNRIRDCFKDVNWMVYTFSADGVRLKTANEVEHFYETPSIDQAIKNLNVILKELG